MRHRSPLAPALTGATLVVAVALAGAASADAVPEVAPAPTPTASAPTRAPAPAVPPAPGAPARVAPAPSAPPDLVRAPRPTSTSTSPPIANPVRATPSPVPVPSTPAVPVPVTSPPAVPVIPPVTAPPVSPPPTVALPTATGLDRTIGRVARTRTVVLSGTNFGNLAGVQVGGQAIPALRVLSPTRVRFVLPAALDFQPRRAVVSLTAASDRVTRPSAVTFDYVVKDGRDRQMGYAFRHWSRQSNAVFGYLSGSDCANFVNQTLMARGWAQTAEWYNRGTGLWSSTWVSSTALSTWLKTRPDLVTRLPWSGRAAVQVGDVVQFRYTGHKKGYTAWDHTAVVSRVVVRPDGQRDISVVQHSYARQYSGPVGPGRTTEAIQFFHLLR